MKSLVKKKQTRRPNQRRLQLEQLEDRRLLATLPFGAMPQDTGEFMLGRIAVTPVLLESNGTIDPNLLDWTASQKANVLSNIESGLEWWSQLLATQTDVHTLDWVIDTTYLDNPVPSSFEPITRVSNDFVRWVPEFLETIGFATTISLETNIRNFNHTQRIKHDADWSFTIFVVNSQPDQLFAPGGSFSRAFAFAGGLFFVTPSNRPASTYAHETGHMFWARDEYPGGGNFYQRRGYYNAQNTNAFDLNPNPNFQHEPSIMSAGQSLQFAWNNVVTSQATLAQLGWRDSNGNGIFDVLDVPLVMTGAGQFQPATNSYRFIGVAEVATLPNRNSSGLQNDITLNRIGRIEYRWDGQGDWLTTLQPNTHSVNLDLTIPLPHNGASYIEIRAIDHRIGITSPTFTGLIERPSLTAFSGLNGFVWDDQSKDGIRQSNEPGLANWTVSLIDSNGNPLALETTIDPNSRPVGEVTSNSFPGVRLSTVGIDADGSLGIIDDNRAPSGTRVLVPYSPLFGSFQSGWRGDQHQLEARFEDLQSTVSVEVFGTANASFARLEAYSVSGELLERVTSGPLDNGHSTSLSLQRDQHDIAYVVIRSHLNTRIGIGQIRFGSQSSTTTGPLGEFRFPGLPSGEYLVQAIPPSELAYTPISQPILISTDHADALGGIELGFQLESSPWQNPVNAFDINQDEVVTPIDALLIINLLNRLGSGELARLSVPTSLKVDVNGDYQLTPIDALLVINRLNRPSSLPPASNQNNSTQANILAANNPTTSIHDPDSSNPSPESTNLVTIEAEGVDNLFADLTFHDLLWQKENERRSFFG